MWYNVILVSDGSHRCTYDKITNTIIQQAPISLCDNISVVIDIDITNPIISVRKGRPVGRAKRVEKCHNCGQKGHNRTTYKEKQRLYEKSLRRSQKETGKAEFVCRRANLLKKINEEKKMDEEKKMEGKRIYPF
ncbi:hypothetical protein Glove_198g51 [Diversispora epigaea]|uniref:Uncharacterized protein n=1 Tax=Diversispora epigaea TaxID=1348612 RepID=A0A397IQ88_9GLOM|nr:hypothetical protein Glove_198g51 [Diversispora epigaea]